MTEVDEGVDDVVSAHEVRCFPVKANQQGTELVNPSKSPLTGKAQFVDIAVEQAFASAFGTLTGTRVFHDVGNELVIEACPASRFGVKGSIGIEVAACDGNAEPLDELEGST